MIINSYRFAVIAVRLTVKRVLEIRKKRSLFFLNLSQLVPLFLDYDNPRFDLLVIFNLLFQLLDLLIFLDNFIFLVFLDFLMLDFLVLDHIVILFFNHTVISDIIPVRNSVIKLQKLEFYFVLLISCLFTYLSSSSSTLDLKLQKADKEYLEPLWLIIYSSAHKKFDEIYPDDVN